MFPHRRAKCERENGVIGGPLAGAFVRSEHASHICQLYARFIGPHTQIRSSPHRTVSSERWREGGWLSFICWRDKVVAGVCLVLCVVWLLLHVLYGVAIGRCGCVTFPTVNLSTSARCKPSSVWAHASHRTARGNSRKFYAPKCARSNWGDVTY